MRNFGTTTQYSHKGTVSWNIPINKLPLLQWLSANASYNADYRWDAAPRLADTVSIRVGNKIQNASTLTLTGSASLTSLYQKIGYLNRVNQEFEKIANGQPLNDKQEYREVSYANPRFSMTAERAKTVTHNLKTEDREALRCRWEGGPLRCRGARRQPGSLTYGRGGEAGEGRDYGTATEVEH